MMSSFLVRMLGPAMGFDSFRSYWFGTLASVTGFQMLTFTQFWLIHRLTEDPIFLGYVGLANAGPAIALNLFGGVLADRIDRKRLIAITQSTNGFLILILGTLTFTDIVSSSHVIVIAFLAGGVNAFDQPARQALYPSLIERSAMSNAVALNSTIWMSNRIIAPAFAGFIITWAGEGVSFLISSAGFFVMVFVVMTLQVRKPISYSNRFTDSKDHLTEDSGLFGVVKFLTANNIFLIDQVSHTKIWEILNKHSVGVIPFKKTPLTEENTPTKLFEMMASGLEIVATKLLPIQNFVDDSIHWAIPGDSLSIAEALLKSFDQKKDSVNISKNKSLIKELYNWDERKEKYLSIFNSK